VPRFAFEKFPAPTPTLGDAHEVVGEAMAIGRTFTEALQKALRSLETGRLGFWTRRRARARRDRRRRARASAAVPHDDRLFRRAARCGGRDGRAVCTRRPASTRGSSTRSCRSSRSAIGARVEAAGRSDDDALLRGPSGTASPTRSSRTCGASTEATSARAHALGGRPVYKTVDTCAAEFAAHTPYHYSTYDDETRSRRATRRR
jgi:carbamoyl-phosphate synthase large subunit